MNPSVLEKLTVIFLIASGAFFLASVIYAVKFKVITSFLFEIEQKKLKKKNNVPDIIPQVSEVLTDMSIPDRNRTTSTISVRNKAAENILLDIVPVEKAEEENVTRILFDDADRTTVPASQMKKKKPVSENRDERQSGTVSATKMKKAVSENKEEHDQTTGTVPVSKLKKESAENKEKHDSGTGTIPIKKKDEDTSVKISKTVAVKNKKPSNVFNITESIVVTTCTEDEIRCIDEI